MQLISIVQRRHLSPSKRSVPRDKLAASRGTQRVNPTYIRGTSAPGDRGNLDTFALTG